MWPARRGSLVRPSIVAIAGGIALAGSPARAEALDPMTSLDWVTPGGCPSKEELVDEVRRALGPSAGASLALISARIRVEERGSGDGAWVATVLVGSGSASPRSIEGPSCASVTSAVALVLAVAIQTAAGASQEAEPTRVAAPPVKLSHFTVGVLGAVAIGSAPSAMGGAFLGLGWIAGAEGGNARLEVDAGFWAAESVHLAANTREGVSLSLQTFGLRGGYAWTIHSASFGPEVGAEVDRIAGTGFSAGRAFEQDSAYVALRAGVAAAWTIAGPLSARGQAEAVIPLAPPEFVVEASTPSSATHLYSPTVGARGMLGLEVRFL